MKYCCFLFFAGLIDAILTHIGISFGIIDEGNPVMMFAINKSWIIFYMIKILLPLLLIGLFYLQPLKGKVKTLLVSASAIYVSVLLIHIGWIVLYLNAPA